MLIPTLETPPARDALRFGETRVPYANLADRARNHARSLLAAGLLPGDRVGVWATPTVATATAFVGHVLSGIVSVAINPASTDAELEHVVRDAGLRGVVGLPEPRASVARPIALGDDTSPTPIPAPEPTAPLLILYTSGTTGKPKGVVHTGVSIASNLDALASAWDLSSGDVIVHGLPFFHAHGLVFGLLGALRAGATLDALARFDAVEIASRFVCGGTVLYASPAQLQEIGERVERDAASASAIARARLLVTGSAPFPVRENARIERVTGHRVIERYGVTEALINASSRVRGERRPGHVGTALDGVEIRLVDDNRRTVTGTLGEIAVRGPNVFAEYVNRPDATRAAKDDDGWFYTGDLGAMDATGTLRIVGRRSTDLIRSAGGIVAAGEVEAALLEQPEVREAAVVGVKDDADGERIVAFVALRAGAVANAEALLARLEIEAHKRPTTLRVLPALPRNAVGKVMKTALRDAAA
jgi:malonyl-CoA/methylmalonyl-CoA synthetase